MLSVVCEGVANDGGLQSLPGIAADYAGVWR
jgi:hypothetical protein